VDAEIFSGEGFLNKTNAFIQNTVLSYNLSRVIEKKRKILD